MTFEEDLRRLTPIIGPKHARRLWRAQMMEDHDGQNDIHAWVRLKLEQKLGHDLLTAGQFLSRPTAAQARGAYYLGEVIAGNEERYPFGLRANELIQHMAIFGRSGAGKTNMVALFLKALAANKKPFLLFDWKQNYRDMLGEKDPIPLEIYTVGRSVHPFRFNPLIPPKGTSPKVWIKKLIEIACNAYFLGEGVTFILQDAIDEIYREFGVYDAVSGRYPTMKDVLEHVKGFKARGRKALWLDSALRALQTLCFGPISDVINVSRNESLQGLLQENAILELDALANAEKIFFIESLMIWIHHFRRTERQREVFKHCIVVEEAHNILRPSEKDDVVNTLMREIREFGECIVLADQHPSQISIPAMGNTFCTIALNVKHNRDIQALGDAMQFPLKDREMLGQLSMGHAVVKMQARFLQPFMIKVPKVCLPKGTITDRDLLQRYRRDSTDSGQTEAEKTPIVRTEGYPPKRKQSNRTPRNPLTQAEEQLMRDILAHPFDGVVGRYSRLNISRRRGNAARLSLIKKGALQAVPVTVKNGKLVLLEPTGGMKRALIRNGVKGFCHRDGGIPHQYWRSKVRQCFDSHGWRTCEEKPVGSGRQIDVEAQRGGFCVAIEIEAGERGPANINKAAEAGYDKVVSFAVNGHAEEKLQKAALCGGFPVEKVVLMTPTDYEKSIAELTRMVERTRN